MHPLTPSNTRLAGLYCAKVDFISRHFCGDKQVVENRGVSSPTRHRCTMRVSLLTASYKCSKSRWRWGGHGGVHICSWGRQQPVLGLSQPRRPGQVCLPRSTGSWRVPWSGRRSKSGGAGVGTGVASAAARRKAFLSPWEAPARLSGSTD